MLTGFCNKVENKLKISVWNDAWFLTVPGFIPTPKEGANVNKWVKFIDLVNSEGNWNSSVIEEICTVKFVTAYMNLPRPSFTQKTGCAEWATMQGYFLWGTIIR